MSDAEPIETESGSGEKPYASPLLRAGKRTADLALAIPLGLLSLPLLVASAVAIKCLSRGPVLYGQERRGQYGRPFRIWKLRTMVKDAEHRLDDYLSEDPKFLEAWNLGFKSVDDPRVIPWIGHVLRFSGLDELPQLWNVITGEMSLVGPRPLPEYHLEQFEEGFRRLRERVPPGITGQWQICSRKNGSPEMFCKWDTYYVRNWSPWLDLKILVQTPLVVVSLNKEREAMATGSPIRPS